MVVRVLELLYGLLLRLYPRHFRDEFAGEMRAVFGEVVKQTARQGLPALMGASLRELLDAPFTLLKAHWFDWQKRGTVARDSTVGFSLGPISPLPPPPPDGRASWTQAGLEASLFLPMGALLVLQTYFPSVGSVSGPLRGLGSIGAVLLLLPVPLFLVGLARGLPRWAYPSGGMLLGYSLLAAIRFRQLPFLAAFLLALLALTAAAMIVHLRVRPLPPFLQRLGQSISVDWTRLSFCVYGATPLTIATAFDDAYFNDRTPYLALSVLFMVAGAFAYARSRRTAAQMTALVGATSLCVLCALLDHVHFTGGKGPWIAESGWLMQLWLQVSALMSAPLLIGLAQRALHRREAPRQ
jgi:hypothetical protein